MLTRTRCGIKKQIRLLNDDIKHLHKKYNAEIGQRKISYSTFSKLRPFWIRQLTSKYKLKRGSKKECCKQYRYVKFKGTMTKIQRNV